MSENLPPLDVEQMRHALRAAKGKMPDGTHQLFQGMLESYLTIAELVSDPTMTDDRLLESSVVRASCSVLDRMTNRRVRRRLSETAATTAAMPSIISL